MSDPLVLFLIGFGIALLSVIVGSSTPLFVVLLQFFFPQLSLGAIIGSNKVVSSANSVGALAGFWKEVDWPFVLKNGPLYVIPAFLGANIVAELDIFWVLPLLVIAFIIAEIAPCISNFISNRNFYILEGFFGIYGGLFGAGVKPMLLSLFRIKQPADNQIVYLKIQIQTIALFSSFATMYAHYLHGNLIADIIIPLAIGSIIGGLIAGKLLVKMERISPALQKCLMRLTFISAIIATSWMIFG